MPERILGQDDVVYPVGAPAEVQECARYAGLVLELAEECGGFSRVLDRCSAVACGYGQDAEVDGHRGLLSAIAELGSQLLGREDSRLGGVGVARHVAEVSGEVHRLQEASLVVGLLH